MHPLSLPCASPNQCSQPPHKAVCLVTLLIFNYYNKFFTYKPVFKGISCGTNDGSSKQVWQSPTHLLGESLWHNLSRR